MMEKKKKKIYLYDYVEDSIVLKELGRLREISFRKVGEGVNKKEIQINMIFIINIYFIWDEKWTWIVGSYRIGNSDFIFKNIELKVFIQIILFKFNEDFIPYLQKFYRTWEEVLFNQNIGELGL